MFHSALYNRKRVQQHLFACVLLCLCCKLPDAQSIHEPYGAPLLGWQSSWNDGEDYGAAFIYDKETHALYITGSTFLNDTKSYCVVTSVDKKSGKIDYVQDYSSSNLASCTSVTQWKAKNLVVSGFTERAYQLHQKEGEFELAKQMVGDEDESEVIPGFFLLGPQETGTADSGKFMTDNPIQYPLIIEEDEGNDAIIIASTVSDDISLNLDYHYQEELPSGKILQPNPTSGVFKYGANFKFVLQQYKFIPNTGTFRNGWSRVFGTQDGKDVRIHDLVVHKNRIFFVGATAGIGEELGDTDLDGSQDLDGFVTQISSADGNAYQLNVGDLTENLKITNRIQSQKGKHDLVNAICIDGDNQSLYLAGSSTGYLGGGDLSSEHAKEKKEYDRFSAFLMKIDVNSLDVIWTRMVHTYQSDIYAPQDVLGMSCVVSSDSERVYLSGIVNNNGNINAATKGFGQDDIFVASYDTDGTRQWRKQVGTDQNDVVGRGHASIAMDENDNVMVLGTTRGMMYRAKSTTQNAMDDSADMFIITFAKEDGSFPQFQRPLLSSKESALPSSILKSNSSSYDSKTIDYFFMGIIITFTVFVLLSFVAYNFGVKRTAQKYQQSQDDGNAEVQRYLEELEKEEQHSEKADESNSQRVSLASNAIRRMFHRKDKDTSIDTVEHDFDYPGEIKFDTTDKQPTSQFDPSSLGIVDDFMGSPGINDDLQKGRHGPDLDTTDNSAYNELLEGLHNIQGMPSPNNSFEDTDSKNPFLIDHDSEEDSNEKKDGIF